MSNIKNPLFDITGRLDWNAFLSLFGIVFILLAFLIAGGIGGTYLEAPDAFLICGAFAATITAILIYGCSASIAAVVVLVSIVANTKLVLLELSISAGLALGLVFTIFVGHQSPFSKFLHSIAERRRFGQSL